MPGGLKTLLASLGSADNGDSLRSGAIRVASARPGVAGASVDRSSRDMSAWPRSVTAECREWEREREGRVGAARFDVRLRLGLRSLLSAVPSVGTSVKGLSDL
jgi:hypothetical protein